MALPGATFPSTGGLSRLGAGPIAQDKPLGTAKLGKSTADSILPAMDEPLPERAIGKRRRKRLDPRGSPPQLDGVLHAASTGGLAPVARLRRPRRHGHGPDHPQRHQD